MPPMEFTLFHPILYLTIQFIQEYSINASNHILAKYGTFVNNQLIQGQVQLFHGDVVFILGLKLIVLGNTLYFNNPFHNATAPHVIARGVKIDSAQEVDHNMPASGINPRNNAV